MIKLSKSVVLTPGLRVESRLGVPLLLHGQFRTERCLVTVWRFSWARLGPTVLGFARYRLLQVKSMFTHFPCNLP